MIFTIKTIDLVKDQNFVKFVSIVFDCGFSKNSTDLTFIDKFSPGDKVKLQTWSNGSTLFKV